MKQLELTPGTMMHISHKAGVGISTFAIYSLIDKIEDNNNMRVFNNDEDDSTEICNNIFELEKEICNSIEKKQDTNVFVINKFGKIINNSTTKDNDKDVVNSLENIKKVIHDNNMICIAIDQVSRKYDPSDKDNNIHDDFKTFDMLLDKYYDSERYLSAYLD